jgi:hypothetical protein
MASTQLIGLSTAGINALGTAFAANTSTQLDYIFSQQIRAITTTAATMLTKFGFVTPVVLDLNGDGIQTTTMQNGVSFDIDNDGKSDQTAWAARGDGLLVRDINHDGQINNGSELFGSATVLPNGKTAADGYVAMSALDTNNDGILDAKDAAFGELMVWADKNNNGISEAKELTRLASLDIKSLSLNAIKSDQINNGNLIGLMGNYTTIDGKSHSMGDVWFQTDAASANMFDMSAITNAAKEIKNRNLIGLMGNYTIQDEMSHMKGEVWFQTDTGQSPSFDLSAAKKSIGTGNIDLRNSQTDRLKLSLNDVLVAVQPDILFGKTQVTINGDLGDSIYLGTDSTSWSSAGSVQDGADSYMVYVNTHVQLLISDKVQINLF